MWGTHGEDNTGQDLKKIRKTKIWTDMEAHYCKKKKREHKVG